MKIPQVANSRRTFSIPGRCVSFGSQVPKGLELIFSQTMSEPIEVEPLSRYSRPFISFELVFPNKVNEELLDLIIHNVEYSQQREISGQSWVAAQGTDNLLALATYDIILPSTGYKAGGAHLATTLQGTLNVTSVLNLPNVYTMENDRNGVARYMRAGRMSAITTDSFIAINSWEYPLSGGILRIVNGATARQMDWTIWAVNK